MDFDGTIGDSQSLIVNTLQQTMRRLRLEVKSYGECASTIGLRLDEAFGLLFNLSEQECALCADTYRAIFAENKHKDVIKAFPHVIETIRTLHEYGIRLAIASSRYRFSLLDYVAQMNIGACISSIVAGDDVENVKPAPDMVFKALREMNGGNFSIEDLANQSLVVGDMIFDIDMAHAAGVRACAVTYGNGTREQLAKADYIIDDFSQLASIIMDENAE